jgi:hypothetical protein
LPVDASHEAIEAAIEAHFERLVDGLTAEAAASDDVFDRDSAIDFADARLRDFSPWLSSEHTSRLRDAVRGKIEAW